MSAEEIKEISEALKPFLPALFKKIVEGAKILKGKIPSKSPKGELYRYKILLVGGGEIAVELSLAGVESFWEPRCVDEEGEVVPMQKLGETANRISLNTNLYKDIKYLSLPYTEAPEDPVQYLDDFISTEKPDIVLLEKNFIPMENWKNLSRRIDRKFRFRNIAFIPDIESINFFTDKIQMKKKLSSLLGENLAEKHLVGFSELDLGDNNETNRKIKEFLKEHNEGILKPAITESGNGQSEIKTEDDILPGIDKLYSARVKRQRKGLIEEKKKIISEVYYAMFRPLSNIDMNPKCIGPIEYRKHTLEFGGPVRLIESRYPPDATKLPLAAQKTMKNLATKICEAIKVPFLGIEYFFCGDNNVFINEIVWRPDDAGFITLLSHTKSQFELFIESLENHELEETKAKDGNFFCVTLLRDQEFQHFPDIPIIPNPDIPAIPEEDWVVRFYQKDFPTTFKRIVGYAMVNLKGGSFSSLDDFKKLLKNRILDREFGREEAERFYF